MRPASVIFLIISVLIIAAGLGLCFFAQNKAEKEGIELFEDVSEENGDIVEIIDFAEEDLEIGRISFDLSDCEVSVSSGERSYVELVNFEEGRYIRSTTNQTLSIEDTISFRSILGFAEHGEFKGIRQYLQYYSNSRDKIERDKKINVYINPQDNIKIYEINVKKGNVALGDLSARNADYKVVVGTGDVTIGNITKSSSVIITVNTGSVDAEIKNIQNLDVTIGTGDFSAKVLTPENQNYYLEALDGSINFIDNKVASPHEENHPIASSTIKAEVSEGDINIAALKNAKQTD